MTDRKAIAGILAVFTFCLLFFTRVHGPEIFFFAEGDDSTYFDYARAFAVTHDFSFRHAARYAVGPGMIWSPLYLLAEVARVGEELQLLFVAMGSMLCGLAGFFFLYFFLRRHFSAKISLLGLLLVGFSSPLLHYLFRRPLMAHSSEFFVLSASMYFISGLTPSSAWKQILPAALFTGLIFLCRWNDAPYVAVFALWAVMMLKDKRKAAFFLVISGAVSCIQLLMWRHVTGAFYPGPSVFGETIKSSIFFTVFPWTFRHLRDLFIGQDWGIFLLSPVTLIAFIGAFFVIKEKSRMTTRVALLLPALPVCWIAANWPSHGGEYGNRYLLPLWPLFIFLFCELLTRLEESGNVTAERSVVALSLISLGLSLMLWTLFKSNADSLTLLVGPTLYEHPSDWVNHSFAINAYKELFSSPVRSLMTLGPSPIGYFTVKSLGLMEKFGDYFIKHGVPTAGYWAGFFGLYSLGAAFIGWVGIKRA